ncbi:MAG: multiheme c-type cytochrome [Pseudomonadota bacterium]
MLKIIIIALAALWMSIPAAGTTAAEPAVSDLTQDCISCHSIVHPGIVADWQRSRHAAVTPAVALAKPERERRMSAARVPDELAGVVVGCAECHMRNPADHKDTFTHNEQEVHVLVSPKDCAVCHPKETEQFGGNIMSWAHKNLVGNELYRDLKKEVNGVQVMSTFGPAAGDTDDKTEADSCLHCHGTVIEVAGKRTRDTDYGEMEFPVLTGWPNQGVGRHNPDGSQGSCTSCHSRHKFSIEMARKPYTCAQCHKGPDVPAYPAFDVSKHGNLHSSLGRHWDFDKVPWTVGKDFTAPTCAACHVGELAGADGETIVERTHRMNDRLPWRIIGLVYAHPHPKGPDTSVIRNKEGLPLPTSLSNEPAEEFLIGPEEMARRKETMQKVCLACHSKDWVDGHWARFENTIKTSNEMTATATRLLAQAWEKGVAFKSPSIFDEPIEKQWVEQWLFFGNSTRFASAMMGADYGVFANGRWYMSKNLKEMSERFNILLNMKNGNK